MKRPGRAPISGRTLVFLFFALYAVAVTYPGVLPFNRISPLIFGLPFVLAWYAGWVVLGGVVLLLYHRYGGEAR